MRHLTEEQIKSYEQELEDAEQTISKDKQLHLEAVADVRTLEEKIKSRQEEIDTMSVQIEELSKNCNQWTQEVAVLEKQIRTIEGTLRADVRQKKIDALLSEQTDFYSGLEKSVEAAQSSLDETSKSFLNLRDPKKTALVVQRKIENRADFTLETIEMRSMKLQYEKLMEDLCTAKIDGTPITLQDTQFPQSYLTGLAYKPEIITLWQK